MRNLATLRSDTYRDFDAYAAAIEDADLCMRLPRLERSYWAMQHLTIAGLNPRPTDDGR